MESYADILARMKKKFTDLAGYSPDDASDIGIRMRLLAGEIYSVSSAVDWLRRQTFAQTANGQELDWRAQERGIVRKEAVPAHGTLTFSRKSTLWFDEAIKAGIVCSTAGTSPVRFATTEDAVLKADALSVEVPAQAEESGCAGNTEAGTVTVLVTAISGIQSVNNSAAFTGGEDCENDDALRARLLQSCSAASNGGNAAYYRDYALSFDGVDSARIVPRANGAGTVALYLGGRRGAPSDLTVEQISKELNAAREICTQVTVAAAETVPVNVTATVTAKAGADSKEVKRACKQALQTYFDTLGVSDPVAPAALNAALFSTGLIRDCTLDTKAVSLAKNQMAVLGLAVITVTEGG